MMKVSGKRNLKGEVKSPLWLPVEIRDEVVEMALRDERSLSYATQKLLLRGLAAFRRDGSWDEPAASEQQDGKKF